MNREILYKEGNTMRILRDLRLSTKLLILIEVTTGSYSRLKQIADKLGITIQGISEYVRIMDSEGLIHHINGEYKATKKGVQFLHENIREFKEFVDRTMERLEIIDICVAIAKTSIKKEEKVGLFMENGVLTAYVNKPSRSTGIAVSDAEIGDDVPIKDLEGIVDLRLGALYILELPSMREGSTHRIRAEEVKKVYSDFKPHKIGALDVVGLALLNKLGLTCDFEFAPIDSAIEAVLRGIDVMVVGSTDNVYKMVSTIDEINAVSQDKIEYSFISFAQ